MKDSVSIKIQLFFIILSLLLGIACYNLNPIKSTPDNDLNSSSLDIERKPINYGGKKKRTSNYDPNTEIKIISFNKTLKKYLNLNQTIEFYFNDTINNLPIPNLNTSNVMVYNNESGTLWKRGTGDHNWTLYSIGPLDNGYYSLNVSTKGLNSGKYVLMLNISKGPLYNWSIAFIEFRLLGNSSLIIIQATYGPGGQIWPSPKGGNYLCYIGSDLTLEFEIWDYDYNKKQIIENNLQSNFLVKYYKINGRKSNGTISNNINHNTINRNFFGDISTSSLNELGDYTINFTADLLNYEIQPYIFNITIKEKVDANITVYDVSKGTIAGEILTIAIIAKYYNGSGWSGINEASINITLYINDEIFYLSKFAGTNELGIATFKLLIPTNSINLKIDVSLISGYYYGGSQLKNINIEIIYFLELIIWFIIIMVTTISLVAYLVTIYQRKLIPEKRKKQETLTELNLILNNAIDLEHLIILYKRNGMCIYNKAFNLLEDDSILAEDVLTIISDFGTEKDSQEPLNKLLFNDKVLLLSDGEFIRVALVLGKNPLIPPKKHLKQFIKTFENIYESDMLEWNGEVNKFGNTGYIFDEIFKISLTFPHKISNETQNLESFKDPHYEVLLGMAKELSIDPNQRFYYIETILREVIEDTAQNVYMGLMDQEFFLVATLLEVIIERTKIDIADFFNIINELRQKHYLIPIDLSNVIVKSITQQELNHLNENISGLINLSLDEKQDLINYLVNSNSIERDFYLNSFSVKKKNHFSSYRS